MADLVQSARAFPVDEEEAEEEVDLSSIEARAPNEWRDSFHMGACGAWRLYRPPAAELKLVLHALLPILSGTQMRRDLQRLADQMTLFEEDDDDCMVPLCQEAANILKEAASVPEMDNLVTLYKPSLVWALTWLDSLVLHHRMRQVPKEPQVMESISTGWADLYNSWPQNSNTRQGLDHLRRLSLLQCGHETEALADFQLPSSWYWSGFEKTYLCYALFLFYSGAGSWDKSAEWIQQAEKAVPKAHEHAPYIKLELLSARVEYSCSSSRSEVRSEQLAELWAGFGELDFEPRLEFPVSPVEVLKLHLMDSEYRHGKWPVYTLVRLLLPDSSYLQLPPELSMDDMDEDSAWYVYKYHIVRGKQLVEIGKFEEGLSEFHRCLAKIKQTRLARYSTAAAEPEWARKMEQGMDNEVRYQMLDALDKWTWKGAVHRDEEKKGILEGFLLAHEPAESPYLAYQYLSFRSEGMRSMFFRNVRAIYGFSGPATLLTTNTSSLFLDQCSPTEAVVKEYWQSLQHYCRSLRTWRTHPVSRSHLRSQRSDDLIENECSFIYSHMLPIAAAAAPLCSVLPPHDGFINEVEDPWFAKLCRVDQVSCEALLHIERFRNSSVLPQPLIEGDSSSELWQMIKRSQRACGPDTVFVLYHGWDMGIRTMMDTRLCIVVQDDGAASCHNLVGFDCDYVLQVVEAMESALNKLRGGNLEDSCKVMAALERLYDLLIRPVFQSFIRTQPIQPHRKLVISAAGYLYQVPFSILRNKDSGQYLFQEVTLSVTPSFLLLHRCVERYEELQRLPLLPGPGAAIAIGNPTYRVYEHPPLPGSGKEVDAICHLFDTSRDSSNDHKVVKLSGKEATVERLLEWVKKPTSTKDGTKYSQAFIHLAAHGTGGLHDRGTLYLAASSSARTRARRARSTATRSGSGHGFRMRAWSGRGRGGARAGMRDRGEMRRDELIGQAVMADQTVEFLTRYLPSDNSGKKEKLPSDAIITSDIDWCAYMAVLSACNTARGQQVTSTLGDRGLGRALMVRGIPCSLLSQWRLDDNTTPHLMQLFYKAMMQGEDVSTALRSAMLNMLQDGSYKLHQIAPFVVSGLPTVCLPPQLLPRAQKHTYAEESSRDIVQRACKGCSQPA